MCLHFNLILQTVMSVVDLVLSVSVNVQEAKGIVPFFEGPLKPCFHHNACKSPTKKMMDFFYTLPYLKLAQEVKVTTQDEAKKNKNKLTQKD